MKTPRVLTVGPDYRLLRGGIASVLSSYKKFDPNFLFLPSVNHENKIVKLIRFPALLWKIFRTIKSHPEIDLVHIHGASYSSFWRKYLIFLVAKRVCDRKVIYHIHGGGYENFYRASNFIVKQYIRKLINGADCVICLSPEWVDFIERNFKPRKVEVLNNVIERPLKLKHGRQQREITNYLFLGDIVQRKGIFDVLVAMSQLSDAKKSVTHLFIGGNGELERLESQICEMGLEDNITILGWIEGEIKQKYLQASDVYILPSYSEGLPISILEAMSYGKAIISTRVGGIPQLVIDNVNGYLVTPGCPEDIADKIALLSGNKSTINEFGSKSTQFVEEYFPEKVSMRLNEIYDQVREG
ncbi:glycosyltransferase family 1 protein [Seongchinamella unica]|uniref:Glycosyltransferase family 1 protein n=1 Tax=Seongchinamella unica TaxID=2547392 RepID=A0A4R5LQQ9_9GAMM|nr:glycosyltransferase family 4 protein [Seongchinamella unica]TDG12880.1 glycosyltransferase family 1 protein [Seongchinamella unica]